MALNKSLDHANILSQVSLTSLQLVVAAQAGQPMQMMGAGPSTGQPLLQIMGAGPSTGPLLQIMGTGPSM
jgi:hypothetical protein